MIITSSGEVEGRRGGGEEDFFAFVGRQTTETGIERRTFVIFSQVTEFVPPFSSPMFHSNSVKKRKKLLQKK